MNERIASNILELLRHGKFELTGEQVPVFAECLVELARIVKPKAAGSVEVIP